MTRWTENQRAGCVRQETAAILALLAMLLLGACDNSGADGDPLDQIIGDPTPEQLAELEARATMTSRFAQPNPDGTFSDALGTIFRGGYRDAAGNGYAVVLTRNGTDFLATTGLLPQTTGGDLPTGGVAAMHGPYQIAQAGKSDGVDRKFGAVETTSGRITLRADFTFGTLRGEDGALLVDGNFSGQTLGGKVYFNQRPADLTGRIGRERAVGAFHGADSDTAFAGGFLVER